MTYGKTEKITISDYLNLEVTPMYDERDDTAPARYLVRIMHIMNSSVNGENALVTYVAHVTEMSLTSVKVLLHAFGGVPNLW